MLLIACYVSCVKLRRREAIQNRVRRRARARALNAHVRVGIRVAAPEARRAEVRKVRRARLNNNALRHARVLERVVVVVRAVAVSTRRQAERRDVVPRARGGGQAGPRQLRARVNVHTARLLQIGHAVLAGVEREHVRGGVGEIGAEGELVSWQCGA